MDGAMACFGKVLEKDVDVAIDCFNKVLELHPNDALALCSLGLARRAKGQVDEAIDCFRKAINIDPNFALAHGALGETLLSKGRFAEAHDALARAVSLLPANHPLRGPAAKQVETCTQLLQLEKRLPGVLSGEDRPDSPDQALTLAWLCRLRRLHVGATRLAAEAFADPQVAPNLVQAHRYNAACSAALAASGQGVDADKLDDKERARLRQQALNWLRADLALRAKQLETGKPADRAAFQQAMRHWQRDSDVAGIRDAAALAKLPAEERAACEKLWADVAALLKKAEAPATEGKP